MIKIILKWLFYLFVFIIAISIFGVVAYKFVPAPVTPIMLLRVTDGLFEGKYVGINKSWVSYEDISTNFFRAVVAAEDARFMTHKGIDWKAVEDAKKYNERHQGKKKRGASTITMQTAKNVFLTHHRNYVRKGAEAVFTYAIEFVWGKKRILEVYANVVEFGEGIYGVEAASQEYFNKSAKDLSRREAALLAAVLPNPRRWSPAKPTPYIERRAKTIMGRMNSVQIPKVEKSKRNAKG